VLLNEEDFKLGMGMTDGGGGKHCWWKGLVGVRQKKEVQALGETPILMGAGRQLQGKDWYPSDPHPGDRNQEMIDNSSEMPGKWLAPENGR
jgi:hypothetical protein